MHNPKKDPVFIFNFLEGIDISVDCTGINVDVRTLRVWCSGDRGERWFRADWDA